MFIPIRGGALVLTTLMWIELKTWPSKSTLHSKVPTGSRLDPIPLIGPHLVRSIRVIWSEVKRLAGSRVEVDPQSHNPITGKDLGRMSHFN